MTILAIALGGALGSVLRHLGVSALGAPWGVAAVNVAGSFAIGALYILLATRTALAPVLMTGLLGGFTTFSAFSLELVTLAERGNLGGAALYAAVSLAGGVAGLVGGLALARTLA